MLLEHYLAEDSHLQDGEHVDQVRVRGGEPEWRRIWPTPPSNPQHQEFERWIHPLHELSTPALLPDATSP